MPKAYGTGASGCNIGAELNAAKRILVNALNEPRALCELEGKTKTSAIITYAQDNSAPCTKDIVSFHPRSCSLNLSWPRGGIAPL